MATNLTKPTLEAVRSFAEGTPATQSNKRSSGKGKTASGQIPDGDVRMTANIREDLHLRLKIRAAEGRTTVGELIEEWIKSWR